jgi:hypothetical protein
MNPRKENLMRGKTCLMAVVVVLLGFSVTVGYSAGTGEAPSVFFPETHFEFSPVLEDSMVVHEFVIQNKGKAVLNVERVKTG